VDVHDRSMSYDRNPLTSQAHLIILAVSAIAGLALGAVTSTTEGFSGAIGMATLLHALTTTSSTSGRAARRGLHRINGNKLVESVRRSRSSHSLKFDKRVPVLRRVR
jgi:hypothetical protein